MNVVDDGLYDVLAASTALTTALNGTAIYWQLAPQGTTWPYVIFFESSGIDENSSPVRARRMMYTIKAVSDDPDEAGDIDGHIDTLMRDAILTVSGYLNYRTWRENDIGYVELTSGGEAIYHRGAQYGIWLVGTA